MSRSLFAIFLLCVTVPAAAQDARTEKGKQVYTAQKCQACHSVAGVGNKKGALDDVGARLKEDDIRQWFDDLSAELPDRDLERRSRPQRRFLEEQGNVSPLERPNVPTSQRPRGFQR